MGKEIYEYAFVARMIVKSLMARHVLYDCGDRPCTWANNAGTGLDSGVDFLFGRYGLLISTSHPPHRVVQSCSSLITREYFLISAFSPAPSPRPGSATNALYRQRNRKCHYSYARGLLLRARNFNKLKYFKIYVDQVLYFTILLFRGFLYFIFYSFLI